MTGARRGLADGGDDAALGGRQFAGDTRAGRGRVPAAAEQPGDVADVYVLVLGAEADARELRLEFLEHTGDDDRVDGADVVDQSLRVAGGGAGAGEVLLLQPKVGNLVVVCEAEIVVNALQQLDAGERVRLVNLVADGGEVGAFFHKVAGGVIGLGQGARVLERAGVGGDGGEQAVGNSRRDFPAGLPDELIDQLAAGGLLAGDPVHVAKAGVAGVVVDVDERPAVGDVFLRGAQALDARGVDGDDAVKRALDRPRRLDELIRIEKPQLGGHGILIPADDLLALFEQRQREAKRRADAVTVRPHVAADGDGVALADDLEDPVNRFQTGLLHSRRWSRAIFC